MVDRVDAVGHDKRGALVAFGQEVAHRAVERPGHADGPALAREKGKRTVDFPDGFGFAGEEALARFLDGHIADAIQRRIKEVNDAFDIWVHKAESVNSTYYFAFRHACKPARSLVVSPNDSAIS